MNGKYFYKGDYKKDAERETKNPRKDKFWIVGHFMPTQDPRKTQDMGIKYWRFSKGEEGNHKPKERGEQRSTECTLILEGAVCGSVNGETITLLKGEYVIINPETPSNLIEKVLESPAIGLTIKAPNVPSGDRKRE